MLPRYEERRNCRLYLSGSAMRMIQFIVKGVFEETPANFSKMPNHYIAEYETLTKEEAFALKKAHPRGFFRLAFWESGGSDFSSGSAQLVCGEAGAKLTPAKVRTRGWLANSNHALFVGKELYVCNIVREVREAKLELSKHSISPSTGVLETEVLWSGVRADLENLPENLLPFKEFLATSVRKAFKYRCLHPMYGQFDKAPVS